MKIIRFPLFQTFNSIWLGLFLILGAVYVQAQESSDEIFAQANEAYNEANYGKAVESYMQILDKGQHSAALYYNLGNAYYRLNQVAESIYFFEKAKQLAPENQDIKINSAFAQNMTIDAIEPLPQSQLTLLQTKIFSLLTLDNWSKLTLGLLWLFALSFLGYLFTQSTDVKRNLFFLSTAFLILFIGTFGITFSKDSKSKQTQYAILISKQIDTWSEPNQQGDLLFILHEGTKVQVLDSLAEWQKIRIANGSEGWLRNCLLYTSPSPRDRTRSRMPSSA